jgi:hypothetical protein
LMFTTDVPRCTGTRRVQHVRERERIVIMEYGSKSWMGGFVDHNPGKPVAVIYDPIRPRGKSYGCELLDSTQNKAPKPPKEPKIDIVAERLTWGVESRISDPDFDEKWEYFVNVVCGGNESQALMEIKANRYDSKRAFVCKAVEAHQRRNNPN